MHLHNSFEHCFNYVNIVLMFLNLEANAICMLIYLFHICDFIVLVASFIVLTNHSC